MAHHSCICRTVLFHYYSYNDIVWSINFLTFLSGWWPNETSTTLLVWLTGSRPLTPAHTQQTSGAHSISYIRGCNIKLEDLINSFNVSLLCMESLEEVVMIGDFLLFYSVISLHTNVTSPLASYFPYISALLAQLLLCFETVYTFLWNLMNSSFSHPYSTQYSPLFLYTLFLYVFSFNLHANI